MALTLEKKPSLVSPLLDFWLLGGLSIAVWLAMTLANFQRSLYGVSNHFAEIATTMAVMALFVNYPHFLASYKLAYSRGWPFLRKHWFQTVLVPGLLLGVLLCCYWLIDDQASRGQAVSLLVLMINFMFFTVGWHYSKQTFGCMMVYAAYDRYPLDRLQRELIRWSLLSVWWYNWTFANQVPTGQFWGLSYVTWKLPRFAYTLSCLAFVGLVCACLVWVVMRNWKRGYRPGVNFLIPYLAMLVWWAPCFRQPDFYFYVVPFFHSLQYLAFVYRIEQREHENQWRPVILTSGLVLTGWLAFEFVPGNLDGVFQNQRVLGFSFFLIAANVFLNVHHYFLDNVLWRVRDDEVVRSALFPKPPAQA